MLRFLYLLLLVFLLQSCGQKRTSTREIALLVKPYYRGEISLAYRVQAACQHLGWRAEIVNIEDPQQLEGGSYDFVLSLVPGKYPHPNCKNYLAIFHPTHHYFNKRGHLYERYRAYDGYLLTYTPRDGDRVFSHDQFPFIQWYPSAQEYPYKQVDPSHLFYVGCLWGNRCCDKKYQKLLQLLDQEPYMRLYGDVALQKTCPHSYMGSIPFAGEALFTTAQDAGVSLVLHSSDHNLYGLPSGRIFEAAAASTVIVCDENAFVRENFGDSVLYVNTDVSAEELFEQIQSRMQWIRCNKEAALEMAKRAHALYKEKFSLEKQLLQLSHFHDELSSPKRVLDCCLKQVRKGLAACALFLCPTPSVHAFSIDSKPQAVIRNTDSHYSLVNSVDFSPQKDLFCATFTHNNKVVFYTVDASLQPVVFQTLQNPVSRLREPQHAAFSPDGTKVVVANWTNRTLALYQQKADGLFKEEPLSITAFPTALSECRPHGVAFSPCGQYLAVAFGAAYYHERAIALFKLTEENTFCLQSSLKDVATHLGIPKGITFSPDGKCLLVTFGESDSLVVFDIDNQAQIDPTPRQIVRGKGTVLSRPEDVKISPKGNYCVVSNSDADTVAFYPFDPTANVIAQNTPCFVLQNPQAELRFPHGLAFSPDGAFLAVTQFGAVLTAQDGNITWDRHTPPDTAKISLYAFSEDNRSR